MSMISYQFRKQMKEERRLRQLKKAREAVIKENEVHGSTPRNEQSSEGSSGEFN